MTKDLLLGVGMAKLLMDSEGDGYGEFFIDPVAGLTKRKQEIHDNSLQAIQVALTVGAIAMHDEFGYGQEVQLRISQRVTELTERYKNEGIKFLLEKMKGIGFEIVNGTVCAYTDGDGNAVTPARARREVTA